VEFSSFIRFEVGDRFKVVFGMTYGVGSFPLRECIWSCLALSALGMHRWKIIFSSIVVLLSGMLILLKRRMIDN
jgi:hypothetical protein